MSQKYKEGTHSQMGNPQEVQDKPHLAVESQSPAPDPEEGDHKEIHISINMKILPIIRMAVFIVTSQDITVIYADTETRVV